MNTQILYCKKTSNGFKIDWEATRGYNPVSFRTFKANFSSQPTEFRVYANLYNYYNYNWKVDGRVIGDESGVGRNTYIYQGDLLLQEPYFEVNMTGISAFRNGSRDTGSDSQIDSTAAIRVQTFDTNVFMYESTPLLGILFTQQISDTFKFIKSEATLVAYPLYFGIPSSLSGVYKWSVNNELIKENTNSISFKKTRDNEESILSLSIEQPRSLLQSRDISYIIDTTR